MHWTTSYIGARYERGAQGPTAWDCWSFARWVQKAHFGRDVPFQPTPASLGSIAKAMPAWAEEFGWRPTEKPTDGDAVFLSILKHPTHVGIWVADLKSVLHCPEGCSMLHDAFHLKAAGWRVRGYFAPVA